MNYAKTAIFCDDFFYSIQKRRTRTFARTFVNYTILENLYSAADGRPNLSKAGKD